VPLDDIASAGEELPPEVVGRTVTASGVYDPNLQLFVVDRAPVVGDDPGADGGYWVLTPLRTPSGDLLPVVRGWVDDRTKAPAPPKRTVEVTGQLQRSENSALAPTTIDAPLQADEVLIVSTAELIGIYPTRDVFDGFLLADPPSPGLQPAAAETAPSSGWRLLNAGYALQWWFFAGFAVFVWFRWLRDAALEGQPTAPTPAFPEESSCPPAR
jgi:cytochrome oxidase assembly protein ShyY1